MTDDPSPAPDHYEQVYDELKALAASLFRHQSPGHTLQPTALVHEAYLKLAGGDEAEWKSRTHFFSLAAKAMRQILIDHHRKRSAQKRGSDHQRVTLSGAELGQGLPEVDILALNEALTRLEEIDERQNRVVELRFFGGLQMDEIADVLGVSKTTVEGEWRHARAWLNRELKK